MKHPCNEDAEVRLDIHDRTRVHWQEIIHPNVSIIITASLCTIGVATWATWAIVHHQDFFDTSTLVVKGGLLLIGAFLVNKLVMQPMVETYHRFIHAHGQWKRNRVQVARDQYTVINEQFHPVSQGRNTYNLKGEDAPRGQIEAPKENQLPGPCTFSDLLRTGWMPTQDQIFLGHLPGGKMVTEQATSLCHIANVASTGGGKSTNIRIVVSQLCAIGAHVILLNPHYTQYDIVTREDWTPIEHKLYKPPIIKYSEIAQWLQWAAEVALPRRLDRFNRSLPWGAPLFIVVEELPSITGRIPDAMKWLEPLLREGRKVHLFVVTAAQDMLCKTLKLEGGAVRDCFRTAFYMGGDAASARTLLDLQGKVDDAGLGKGVVLLRSQALPIAQRVRVPYADNDALYQLLGPSTFDYSKIVDADPDTDEVPGMEDLPLNNVTEFPKAKEERKVATLQEAIQAWNAGNNTRRTMAETLGVTEHQAMQWINQIKAMQA